MVKSNFIFIGFFALLLFSGCNGGDDIIAEDHKLRSRIIRGLGIWSVTRIEDGVINADGNYTISEVLEPDFVYYQFLYRAEVIFGTEAEYWTMNVMEHDGQGTQLNFWGYWIEIQDMRIVARGIVVPDQIYTVQHSTRNKMELVYYTNQTGPGANKRTIFLEYCGSCKPVVDTSVENGI
jgi:hypothetical protein